MTIQPSIVIWTVICFIITMVVLDRLLFKPLLKVMRDRREKIEKGLEAKALAEAELAEAQRAKDEAREEAERVAREQNEKDVRKADAYAAKKAERRADAYEKAKAEARAEIEKEGESLDAEFDKAKEATARALSERIMSGESL